MHPHLQPNHVALLVRSVEAVAARMREFGCHIGPTEEWDGEGTKEIYVEREKGNSLLLMEPIKPGAYQRALHKRGPGLHHLAVDVLNVREFIGSLAGSGWLLHPVSLRTLVQSKTVYLARPGFPALIEVQERSELHSTASFVSRIEVPLATGLSHLPARVGLGDIVQPGTELTIWCGDRCLVTAGLLENK